MLTPVNPFASPFMLPLYRKPKRIRTAFSPAQLLKLEDAFEKNQYVVGAERKQLAKHLNLTETQVKVWFQNRRTKHKRQKDEEEKDPRNNSSSSSSTQSWHPNIVILIVITIIMKTCQEDRCQRRLACHACIMSGWGGGKMIILCDMRCMTNHNFHERRRWLCDFDTKILWEREARQERQ